MNKRVRAIKIPNFIDVFFIISLTVIVGQLPYIIICIYSIETHPQTLHEVEL